MVHFKQLQPTRLCARYWRFHTTWYILNIIPPEEKWKGEKFSHHMVHFKPNSPWGEHSGWGRFSHHMVHFKRVIGAKSLSTFGSFHTTWYILNFEVGELTENGMLITFSHHMVHFKQKEMKKMKVKLYRFSHHMVHFKRDIAELSPFKRVGFHTTWYILN